MCDEMNTSVTIDQHGNTVIVLVYTESDTRQQD